MSATSVHNAKSRYLRRREFARLRRSKKFQAWLAARANVLKETGELQEFTVSPDGVKASATLTLTGQPLDGETLTIGEKVYTFQDTLTDEDGHIHIQSGVALDIAAIIAAVNGGDRLLPAWNALVFSGVPSNGDTVTIGDVTYTFNASVLTDEPNNILIGSASETRDNLAAAINATAGEGTVYGTGTVEHPLVAAATFESTHLIVTAKVPGPGGNTIAATESADNVAWQEAGGTLVGGAERYAAAMTPHPDVEADDGDGDVVVFLAREVGRAGNDIAVDEDMDNGSFGDDDHLDGGEEAGVLEITEHNLDHLEGPMLVVSSGDLPDGLSASRHYFVMVLDEDHIQLAANRKTAKAGTPVSMADEGTGTLEIGRAAEVQHDIFEWNKQAKAATLQALTDIDDL